MDERWNHNIEYQRVIRDALGDAGLLHVLEVGCGDGVLAGALAPVCRSVTALDRDEPSIERARAATAADNVCFVIGDLLAHPFRPAAFDAVVSVATLHHMDEGLALDRMARLLRPGGLLAVVGPARSRLPLDLPWEVAGAVTTRVLKRRHGGYWESDAPKVWLPPSTYRELERLADAALPGVAFRRHVLWRCSLVWRKPTAGT